MMIYGRHARVGGRQKLSTRSFFGRDFLGLIVCVMLFAFNFPALAQQQNNIARIGFIGVRPDAANYSAKFILNELQKLGYSEGKTFTFEYRTADNQLDRLPRIVDELIRLKIDVLITAATRELYVAKKATKDIPIVSLNIGDPVASGLVQSLARPGGNITGFTPLSVELTSKRLELLKETVPAVSQVRVLYHPLATSAETWKQTWKDTQMVSSRIGVRDASV